MVLRSFFQLPMFAFELSSENHTKKTADKIAPLTHTHIRARMCVCVCRMYTVVSLFRGGYKAVEVVLVPLKGLVQCVRGPFRLLSSQTKLW